MTENIKTTISTGKNTFDAKGDFYLVVIIIINK